MTRFRWRSNKWLEYQPFGTNLSGGGVSYPPVRYPLDLQVTLDELNHIKQLGFGREDIGGPFESFKIQKSYGGASGSHTLFRGDSKQSVTAFWTPFSREARGNGPAREAAERSNAFLSNSYKLWSPNNYSMDQILDNLEDPDWNIPGYLDDNSLDVLGTTAISICKPTTPAVDLATAVAEFISERKLFSVPGTSGTISGEYLNYSLGLSPLIDTIKDLRSAMERQEEIISQYERDAGRLVRRRFDFAEVVEVNSDVLSSTYAPNVGSDGFTLANRPYYSGTGISTMTCKSTYNKWFSGAFTYGLPPEGWRRTLRELDKVYGIVPGIDTAWEVIPFSFVADYFADTGNVLKNISAFGQDGLVMPYGYIMSHAKHEVENIWHGTMNVNNTAPPYVPHTLVANYTIEVKQRRPATPFGFGINPGSLNLRQLSILAALGINLLH